MKLNLTRALALFLAAYIIVSFLAVGISLGYGMVSNLPTVPGLSPVKQPVFTATVPYHVLVMLIVWPLFAVTYFKKPRSKNAVDEKSETRNLAFLWLALAIIVDFVSFVWISTPYSLTPHAFYVDYQPWISLIYLAIFLSPWIRLRFSKR